MKRIVFCLCLLLLTSTTFAATYTVNPLRAVSSTNFHSLTTLLSTISLAPGDEVVLRSGQVFREIVRFNGVQGTAEAPIKIRTSGAGRAVFDGSTTDVSQFGYLIYFPPDSAYISFENIEVRNVQAGPDRNDRAMHIRGSHITITGCHVHHNPNGIFSSLPAMNLLVTQCHIHHNGTGSEAFGHNVYLQGRKSTVSHSYIHDAQGGINLKDRSLPVSDDYWATEILYNRIEDARMSGYEVDLSGQGSTEPANARLVGNFIKSANGGNRTMVMAFGNDQRRGVYHMAYNTVVGQRPERAMIFAFNSAETTLVSNIWAGGTSLLVAGSTGYLYGQYNFLMTPGTNHYSLADTMSGSLDLAFHLKFVPPMPAWIATISQPEFEPPANAAAIRLPLNLRTDGGQSPGCFGSVTAN